MRSALIVEDLPDSRLWLEKLVRDAFPDITTESANSLAGARTCLSGGQFGLILLDIGLPDGSGIDLLKELSGTACESYVVMTTIYDDDDHLFGALQAGAQGYLLKDQPRQKLIEQLQGIISGEPPLSPSIARRILGHFQYRKPDISLCEELSMREVEVLRLLANGHTRTDIALALGISANTVAGHTKNIYRKLNVSGRAEATLQAVRLGVVGRD